jgi:hypothetical protein
MRRSVGILVVVAVAATALIGAPSASAILTWPQHVGDTCAATGTATGQTAIVLGNDAPASSPSTELTTAAPPETPSVITRWKVNAPAGLGPTPEQLVTFRAAGETEEQLLGESSIETVVGGASNEFLTRIPVPEYAHVGLRGPEGALVCAEASNHLAGLGTEPWGVGESRRVKIEVGTGVPVIATFEPDRDRDGYGDETQDQCLEQPLLHTPCPFVRLIPDAKVFRHGILVEVGTGDPTHVEVTGQVAWGYRPRGGGPKRHLVVGLSAGGSQEVGANATVGFWLPLPKSVSRRLAQLTTKEKLKAHLAIVATDVIGHQTNRAMGVRLPGWAKLPAKARSSAVATLPG